MLASQTTVCRSRSLERALLEGPTAGPIESNPRLTTLSARTPAAPPSPSLHLSFTCKGRLRRDRFRHLNRRAASTGPVGLSLRWSCSCWRRSGCISTRADHSSQPRIWDTEPATNWSQDNSSSAGGEPFRLAAGSRGSKGRGYEGPRRWRISREGTPGSSRGFCESCRGSREPGAPPCAAEAGACSRSSGFGALFTRSVRTGEAVRFALRHVEARHPSSPHRELSSRGKSSSRPGRQSDFGRQAAFHGYGLASLM